MKAILVSVIFNSGENPGFEELELLCQTAGYEVVGTLSQQRGSPDRTYYVGKGKAAELKDAVAALEADTVIFDNDVSGMQLNFLESYLEAAVIDRATLILEIFAKHATSNEGKLQVELARKKHEMPRILGKAAGYTRQGGGGGGGGGARRGGGEQKLELDRRTLRQEVRDLQGRLKKLSEERALRREKRISGKLKTVCIVGYTNAGKSTLMNMLTKADVLAENKLFATLDPVSRRKWISPGKEFILTDTVGFISRLPHEFIEAFKSTLEETSYADLILHVVNLASPDVLKEFDVVEEVLSDIGAKDIPRITVLNKNDIAEPVLIPGCEDIVTVSALTGGGIEQLLDKICEKLFE